MSEPRSIHIRDRLASVLAWRNWGIFRYNSIWQNIAALFYLAITEQLFNPFFLFQVLLFIAFSTVMTGLGYLLNDLADKDLDRLHGKPNIFDNLSSFWSVVIILGVVGLGFVLGRPFLSQQGFGLLWLLWVIAAASYSLPPARLKKRGLSGLVVTVAAQQTLPTAMLFTIFGSLNSPAALIFIAYATVRGLSSDISHQMRELSIDKEAGVATFAVRTGELRVRQIYAFSLEAERLGLGAVVLHLLLHLPQVELLLLNWPVSLAWPVALIYLPLLLITAGSSVRAFRRDRLDEEDPYNERRQAHKTDPVHVMHHTFPTVVIPVYLAFWMTNYYWPNLVFIGVLFLLYGLFSPSRWTAAWPLRPLLAYWKTARNQTAER